MNKNYNGINDLINMYSKKYNVSVKEAEKAVRETLSCIEDSLLDESKEGLQIIGLFTMKRVIRAPRAGYDFKTGGRLEVPSKTTLKFDTGKLLSAKLNK